MTTLTIRISEEDLKLLREISDSRGTSPAQVIREMVRLYLAEARMLDEKDAERVIGSFKGFRSLRE
jgi:hypothetical protein